MPSYSIIDEPKQHQLNAFIVNPIIILFASMLVPIFINLPYYGRIWMPALWLIINSLLLKSASRTKEIGVALLAVIVWFFIIYGIWDLVYLHANDNTFRHTIPYLKIFSQAVFYFCLIYAASLQSTSYSLYEYINKRNQ